MFNKVLKLKSREKHFICCLNIVQELTNVLVIYVCKLDLDFKLHFLPTSQELEHQNDTVFCKYMCIIDIII